MNVMSHNLKYLWRKIIELMKKKPQLLKKQIMLSEKKRFESVLIKQNIWEENMLSNFINGRWQRKAINEKMPNFIKSLSFKVFAKQKWRRLRELMKNEAQRVQKWATWNREWVELDKKTTGLKKRKWGLENDLPKTMHHVSKIKEKTKRPQIKLEKLKEQRKINLNDKLELHDDVTNKFEK